MMYPESKFLRPRIDLARSVHCASSVTNLQDSDPQQSTTVQDAPFSNEGIQL